MDDTEYNSDEELFHVLEKAVEDSLQSHKPSLESSLFD